MFWTSRISILCLCKASWIYWSFLGFSSAVSHVAIENWKNKLWIKLRIIPVVGIFFPYLSTFILLLRKRFKAVTLMYAPSKCLSKIIRSTIGETDVYLQSKSILAKCFPLFTRILTLWLMNEEKPDIIHFWVDLLWLYTVCRIRWYSLL